MKDLSKIQQVAERFVSVANQPLPEHFDVELSIALTEYQLRSDTPLNLDSMLATDDLYSFKHDLIGIFNKDNFVPRFATKGE
jgi:hypothetical protein